MSRTSTKKQEIYRYIVEHTEKWGYPPAIREICAAVGLRSPSAVHAHLKSLHEEGALTKTGGKTRALSLPREVLQPGVPILGHIAAGRPLLAEEQLLGRLSYDPGRDGPYFALIVRGESMRDAGILDGDYVVVRQQPTAQSGEIVAALLEDEATVKRLHLEKGKIWLMPENEAYEPIDGDGCEILGRVMAVVREL